MLLFLEITKYYTALLIKYHGVRSKIFSLQMNSQTDDRSHRAVDQER